MLEWMFEVKFFLAMFWIKVYERKCLKSFMQKWNEMGFFFCIEGFFCAVLFVKFEWTFFFCFVYVNSCMNYDPCKHDQRSILSTWFSMFWIANKHTQFCIGLVFRPRVVLLVIKEFTCKASCAMFDFQRPKEVAIILIFSITTYKKMKEVWVASPEKFNSPGHVHYLSLASCILFYLTNDRRLSNLTNHHKITYRLLYIP